MDDEKRLRTVLPAAGAGVGALLLLFLAGQVGPVERPFEIGRQPGTLLTDKAREPFALSARLWQDPLEILSTWLERSDQPKVPLWNPPVYAGGPIIVMGVVIPSESSSEDGERRIRQRVSVVSALALQGFVPARNRELFVYTDCTLGKAMHFAYEWFVPGFDRTGIDNTQAVAVLWLPEGWSAGDPKLCDPPASPAPGTPPVYAQDYKVFPSAQRSLLRTFAGHVVRARRSEDEINIEPSDLKAFLIGPAASNLLGELVLDQLERSGRKSEQTSPVPDISPPPPTSVPDISPPPSASSPPSDEPPAISASETCRMRLAPIADNYLDSGYTGRDYYLQSAKDCDEEVYRHVKSLYDGVVETMTSFGLSDSDVKWVTNVADMWMVRSLPRVLGAESARAVDEAVSALAALADAYLDAGLPVDHAEQLRIGEIRQQLADLYHRFDRVERASVRKSLGTAAIVDSDPDWLSTVAGLWLLSNTVSRGDYDELRGAGLSVIIDFLNGVEAADREKRADDASANASKSPEEESREAAPHAVAASSESKPQWQPLFDFDEPVLVFVDRATVPLRFALATELARRGRGKDLGRFRARILTSDAGVGDLRFTVADDEALAKLLVDELARRGVDLQRDAKAHVALLAEWDTLYGRSLPFAFEAVVQRERDENRIEESALYGMRLQQLAQPPNRVYRFSYLRGLDGVLPQKSLASEKAATKESDPAVTDAKELARRLERHEGPGQLDLVRRLAAKIEELDAELRFEGKGRIRAIGILGSDFYDKQLALQVLRERFPRAVFFTTDMDARYLEPRYMAWNRNLVVASGFGLTLDEKLQCYVPPFRDTYATSAFLATLAGLSAVTSQSASWLTSGCQPFVSGEALAAARHPRLFEIGRGAAVDITPFTAQGVSCAGDEGSVTSVHPPPREGRREARWMFGLVIILAPPLAWLLASPAVLGAAGLRGEDSRARRAKDTAASSTGRTGNGVSGGRGARLREQLRRRPTLTLTLVAAATALSFAALGRFALSEARRDGEPLLLSPGVSLWPVEILRLLAIVVGCLLLWRAVWRVRESDYQLCPRFLPRGHGLSYSKALRRERRMSVSMRGLRDLSATILGRVRTMSVSRWRRKIKQTTLRSKRRGREPSKSAYLTWCRYSRLSRPQAQLTRVGLNFVVAVAFISLLYGAFGAPNSPYRGERLGRVFDVVLDWGSLSVLLFLTLFVWDTMHLGGVFVEALSNGRTRWPAGPNGGFLSRLGLRPLGDSAVGDGATVPEPGDVPEDLSEYLDVIVIAERTEALGRLIMYPFVVLLILMISRSRYFDDLNWPWTLVTIVLLLLALAIYGSVILRRDAVRARRRAIGRLELRRVGRLGRRGEELGRDELNSDQLEGLVQELRSLNKGAFTAWSENPVVGAILIPFGGAGVALLIELLRWSSEL